MDPRPTRRDAEKAARDLLAARAAYIGDLRVTLDQVDAGDDLITAANREAERILTDARQRAATVTSDAQTVIDRHKASYATAYKSAIDAGWKPAELTTLGFTATTTTKKRTTTRTPAHTPNTEPPTQD